MPRRDRRQGLTASLPSEFLAQYALTETVLGKGSYAEVRKAMAIGTERIVAVKIIDKSRLGKKELAGLQKEVDILKKLDHPNIVRFYDSYESSSKMLVVMEYLGGGDLYTRLLQEEEEDFTEDKARLIVRTLAEALRHCNDHGVVHRDIKPQNILLGVGNQIKLADFNLSMNSTRDQVNFSVLETMCGTPNYVAPEILRKQAYNAKCDIWSVGVIAFLILSGGYLPFYVDEEGERAKDLLLQKVMRGQWDFHPRGSWAGVSTEAKRFLKKVMEPNPDKRYNYKQMLDDPWLASIATKTTATRFNKKIELKNFKNSELKRTMLAAAAVFQAVDAFKAALRDPPKDLPMPTFGNMSGESGFNEVFDH